ncbi:glycoside hydrolase family 3 N-terminal domain-containing protein [Bacteroides sp.]
MKKYLIILLFFCFGEVVHSQTDVQPLLLYKAEQDSHCRQWVDSVMNRLSLKEKVGQLFVYTIAPVDTKSNQTLLREAVDTYKVGGLLFSGGEMQTQAILTNQAQRMARLPLMITFDGEWGLAMRLRGTPLFPRNMVLGCIQDNRLIYEYGREMARQCRELGVQVNFAPVADVNINPENPVINNRSFGENPAHVADKVIAYATGLESGRVLSVCKHFPGHGDTNVDSHKALPVLPFTRERLDSVELYPFKEAIQVGLSGMMVGHLQVPVLEPSGGLPSSLSRNVVHGLLTEELGFKGLIFTDALAMKGVAGNTSLCLQALQAGNDMVLAPRNLKVEVSAVIDAVERGDLSLEEIERKCRKVLIYKYALGLNKRPNIQLSGLSNRIHTSQASDLIHRLNLAAITVLNNKEDILPLHPDKEMPPMALLEVGGSGDTNALAGRLEQYTSLVRFRLHKEMTEGQKKALIDSLAGYRRIIVAVSEQRLAPFQSFFAGLAADKKTPPAIYLFFTPGKTMLQIQRAVSAAQAVVLAHSSGRYVQRQVADILFARATADGRLSASLGGLFPTGAGVTITPRTPFHFNPEEYGMSFAIFNSIDSIARKGIKEGAYPGCQIVVMKDGKTMYDRCFGTHAGEGSALVRPTDVYDIASLSKTTGTLLALMKLYERGRFNLSDRLSDYLPWLKDTNKENITVREVLFHQSGLPAGIVLYPEAIDKESYKGHLFAARRDAQHPLRLGTATWANPNFRFKPDVTSKIRTSECTLQICDSLWLNKSFLKVLQEKIVEVPLRTKQYRYSDIGFILLRFMIEELSDMSMDEYLAKEFYTPMGLERTLYLPLQRIPKAEIVPSTNDRFLRKCVLQGFVHDECAAFQGGVAGNAGLFSNAREVARIYQMLLNGGELDGRRYLSRETCELFTTEVSKISRRGLGFDRPDVKSPDKSPCAKSAPASVYGHTGFTGTCAWVDPDNKLVYVFLSNRTYPNATNRKLMELDIRPQIQEMIYKSLSPTLSAEEGAKIDSLSY